MESSKLKNIVLLILVITNALLLALAVSQRAESRRYHQQPLLDAVDLLAQQGIAVRAEDIPDQAFPPSQVLEQDPQRELELLRGLLGDDTVYTRRGQVSLYTGTLGSAEIWEDGTFSVTLAPGAYPLGDQDIQQHGLIALKRMGMDCQVTGADENVLSTVETLAGMPVFSCPARLTYEKDELHAIAGTRLTGVPVSDPQAGQALSIPTLLVQFRGGVINSGDACTAVLSASQGYILNTDSDRKLRLTPVLRLETDTNLYILNALTGELQRM